MTPDPNLTASQLRALERLFPGGGLLTSPEETLVYGADSSRNFARPAAVVRPANVEQVAAFLAFAHAERIPVHTRGRGTNRVGGCVPAPGGIVLSTALLNRILEISPRDFVGRAEPGVATAEFKRACRDKRLYYPPDPASVRFSTLGGNIATNAGGMSAVKYGVTRDSVLGLTVALPGGRVLRTGSRCHKDVAGLDLTGLFVGSEGTLGVVVEATLKLLPLPEAQASLLAVFAGVGEAMEAVDRVFAAGLRPAALEFLPSEALTALSRVGRVPWPDQADTALLFRLDGTADGLSAEMDRLRRLIGDFNPLFLERSRTPAEEEALWDLRSQISQAAFTLAPNKMSEDIAVPRGRVAETVRRLRELGRDFGLTVLAFGHLGDGNLHVNVLYDASDPDQVRRSREAKQAVLGLALELDGTITGEHGVGLTKIDWLPRKVGSEARDLMRAVKAVFDPHGIMNPGRAY